MITTRLARRYTAAAIATLAVIPTSKPAPVAPVQAPEPLLPDLNPTRSQAVSEYLARADATRVCKDLGAVAKQRVPNHIKHMSCMRREIELRCKLADMRMRKILSGDK